MSEPGPIVIAGGGTAGHVLPGLAVANELLATGRSLGDLLWIGSARGQEATLVSDRDIPLIMLPGRGIERRVTVENVRSIWALCRAFVMAIGIFRRTRPRAVLTLGGYASVAASFAAMLFRVPIVVAEQNARAGAANRLVGRFARSCAVPFADTDLPRAVVCGNPVRPEILAVGAHRDRAAARARLDMPEGRTVLLVFAGSLGSRRINEAVLELRDRWDRNGDLHIHHVLGRRDFEQLAPESIRPRPGRISYAAVEYEERMDLALAAADLAVCRSGGTTVAELAIVGVPAILVPLPIATRDHQTFNAAALVAAGAAILVPDAECDADRLEREATPVLADADLRMTMAAAARSIGRPDAARRVADLLEAQLVEGVVR